VTWVVGPSERALRFVPFAGGVAALLIFPLVSRRFQRPWVTVYATALFALAPTLIAHGAEFKPYSTDLVCAIVLTLAAFGLDGAASRGRWIGASLLGVVGTWFSQGAVFVVAGLGLALLLLEVSEGRVTARLIALLAVWGASAVAAALSGTHRVPPAMREYLDRFWNPFLPKATVLAFIAVAAVVLWTRDRRAALLLLGPVVVTLGAAAAGLYPFAGRAILFLAPAAVLAIAEAGGALAEGLARVRVPRRVTAAGLALVPVALLVRDPPVYRDEDTRPVLAELARRREPDDAIYVYYAAGRSFRFYAPLVHVEGRGAVMGGCHRADPREYLRELDRLRGRPRVWVFRTHVSARLAEGPLIDGYLSRLGKRVEKIEAEDTDATLWDLSGNAAPPDAAETYPLPSGDSALASRFGCGRGPIGVAPWD
jgi:hypothetical protein